MQLTLHVGLSVLAALVSLAVAGHAWRRRPQPGTTAIAAFTAATAVWTGGNALQVASTTLGAKLLWVDVQYVGITVVPLAWFAFACEYTDRSEWLTRRRLAALAAPGVLTLVLAWTNQYHHLVRTASEVVVVDGVATLDREFGPVFYAATVYSNLVTGVGTLLLLRGLVESRDLYHRQTFAVLAGTTVPWAATVLYNQGRIGVEPEVFFAVTGVAFAYAIAQYDLLDVVPVGRRTVVEQLDDPVLVLDADDSVVDANPAASLAFGWTSADAAIGRPFADACGSQPEFVERYQAGDLPGEVSLARADGIRRYYDVQVSSLADETGPSGEPSRTATVLVCNDVTGYRQYEQHLERQNDYLERMGRAIAHDVRNPLNVAQGHLEFVRDGEGDPDEHLDKVADAHRRMDAIVAEVLDVATDETPVQRDQLSLEAVARNAWANVETGDATLALDGPDCSVEADKRQLTSVFENLFRNAVEHAGREARIRVGCLRPADDSGDSVEDRDAGAGSGLASLTPRGGFYVADDGPGVPPGDRESVFDQGYTTRSDGIGVGLALVNDVADRHGWTVSVTESDDGGARFEIRGVTATSAELARAEGVPR